MIRAFLVTLALVLLCAVAEAKPRYTGKPRIEAFASKRDGALFVVVNPLPKAIWAKFECNNAFSNNWIEIPPRKAVTVDITAMDRIHPPCRLTWRAVPRPKHRR